MSQTIRFLLLLTLGLGVMLLSREAFCSSESARVSSDALETVTPIKNLIVLFEENEAFDKIFGTYPYAANPEDEKSPRFYGVVGNKVPNNYLKVGEYGLPIDLSGNPITQFSDSTTSPQFNALITDNPNEIAPYRQSFNTYSCYSSHQYNDELWAYGIWHGHSNLPGTRQLDGFVRYGGLGYGGSIFLNNLQYIRQSISNMDSPYWRQRLGWGCFGPPNHLRNIYNAAGNPGTKNTVYPESELMSDRRTFFTVKGGFNMGYWDGNTTQALWRYAQRFAMSDNFHQLTYGPSTLGHLSLVYGATGPINIKYTKKSILLGEDLIDFVTQDSQGGYYMVSDLNPALDICRNKDPDDVANKSSINVVMAPSNIGDKLSAHNISWGWFSGGFRLSSGKKGCGTTGVNQYGASVPIYTPGTQPFQYSNSTANPLHKAPAFGELIGGNGAANHQYDLINFVHVLDQDRLPAVSFLKPKANQDGHGDFSSPADEQNWLVNMINKIQLSSAYKRGEVAIIIAQDDSDGSYDHVLLEPKKIYSNNTMYGLGPRLAFLALSPYSKKNYVDSTLIDQASIMKFIKYNWGLGDEPINPYSQENGSGSFLDLFDFTAENKDVTPLLLYCDGSIYDGSTRTPPPIFQTPSGRVAKGENSLGAYRNLKLKKDVPFSNAANLPIRKQGYKTAVGQYECANQFGY